MKRSCTGDRRDSPAAKRCPGAGFQTWNAANLNNNGAPYWDAFTKNQLGNKTSRNIGFCLTNSGDCVGINSALSAPGAIPFWGTYDSAADTGGGQDALVYFKSDNKHLKATLQLQLATAATEINEFGWFETNSKGTTLGPLHRLFQGSGLPPGPSPVGKEVTFKPTKYFGFYYKDASEGGCAVFTIAGFTAPACSSHVFAVFATKPGSKNSAFEIAGLDPPGCGDEDCNLTLVRIQRHGTEVAENVECDQSRLFSKEPKAISPDAARNSSALRQSTLIPRMIFITRKLACAERVGTSRGLYRLR